MNRAYDDLLSLTDSKPTFYQKDGVPRWAPFHPGQSTGVYAEEAATLEVSCQSCDARFHVLIERRSHDHGPTIAQRIEDRSLHYGDPPNVGCCISGPSMNSEPVSILGYWRRERFEWIRDETLQIPFRRWSDPMTQEARLHVERMLSDPETDENLIEVYRSAIEGDDEKIAGLADRDEPVRYSEYREEATEPRPQGGFVEEVRPLRGE